MNAQSFIRRHLLTLGMTAAVLVLIIIPVGLWLLGIPVSQFGIRETYPKLIVAGIALGAVVSGFWLVLDRVSPKVARSSYMQTVVQLVVLAAVAAIVVFLK